ncbi:MAG TPA: excinuclease ABC subunit A, partial [Oligoflexia bacterium]|nr:excinuclease ABC subunit A [Oligoflexia bacterium]
DVSFPLQKLVVITGVSGSGKSTLVRQCLYEPYQKVKQGRSLADIVRQSSSPITGLSGFDAIDDIVLIDQSPAGKTPRSNPATYTKAWDHIRECFAETPQAQRLGLSKSAFSFNVDGGRCPACKGAGQIRIEMQFLADVFIPCAACGGSRFQDKVLEVLFAGKNVLDFLNLTLDETASCFAVLGMDERAQKINLLLQPLLRLGLGYLRLGHPLNNVSGGEAQRIKLASYLSTTAKEKCLFILDEPTTGLHPYNIADLLAVFNELKASGHSLLVIEHNLDVISHADWVVDLGPEGGEKGGRIVAQGPPADLIKNCANFPESSTALLLHNQRGGCRVSAASDAALPFAPPLVRPGEDHAIEIIGAREHNLQNITARIPHNKITVVTGVSGSGKSTLAFDIVFAEGQRRYIDCLSPYARQYIKQLSHADVDRVNYIPPTIAVSQKTAPPLGVSTVATTTEIYQYLRLLYAKAGTQHCVVHDLPITSLTLDSLCATIAHRFKGQRIFLYAPVVTGRKGIYNDLFNRALKAEITEARIDGQVVKLEPGLRLERHKLHSISLAVGSIRNPSPVSSLLREAVEQCLLLGNGSIEVFAGDAWGEPELFSIARVCPDCGRGYRELDPQDFSFRSARGVCVRCSGWGRIAKGRSEVRDTICPDCHGARIGPVGRHVYVENQRIFELTSRSAVHLLHFIQQLKFPPRMNAIVQPIISELQSRLQVIIAVGLDYLELDRDSSSISGGEAQRLRLARALGSPLTGVCYVLDEPSIGLHPQDQEQLMAALAGLRDNGNTVLIVEHDEETIRSADHVIDVGPKGGAEGGGIVICGTPQDIENCQESLTGAALRERSARIKQKILNFPPSGDLRDRDCLIIRGVTTNNLCHISARIPLKRLTVIAGVSGAGKSSLVHGALVPAVIENLTGKKEKKKNCSRNWDSVENLESIERLVEIDQSPPGKTSTSTPASFLGIFDDVRKIYAMLSEARARGWNASHFSFNTGKGRCGECQGKGTIKVPMSFLPDAVNVCESCNGLRYNDSTLEVLYQGISIGDMLQKTMLEARSILANHKAICRSLDYVVELGLGYLTLGQPTYTLSGGEIQRLKIAREFGLREAVNTIYILDEPTIGLHMNDVDKLRNVLQKLVDRENTVVVIEHNLDLIRSADHLIELGPGAAAAGGRVLFAGHPEALLRASLTTPTRTSLLTLKRKIKAKKGANGRNSAR